jgi:mannose/fructose/N-acetylgalactosamine-specific phosphotransferase system component IIC
VRVVIVQAILVALITTCCTWWFSHVITRTWLYPLWSGFLVGLVLGKPVEGMMIAAAINLPYVGFITAGGSMPGNPQFAGPVGTALALVSGLDVNSATTVGVILGSVTIMVWTAYMSINTLWVHMAEDFLNKGNIRAMRMCNYIPSFFVSFILNGIPAMLVVLYGAPFGEWFQTFPQWIVDGFGIVGGLMPALGIAMLLQYLNKPKLMPFFFLGFALAEFMGLTTMMVTFIAALVAICSTTSSPIAPRSCLGARHNGALEEDAGQELAAHLFVRDLLQLRATPGPGQHECVRAGHPRAVSRGQASRGAQEVPGVL